MPKNSSHKQGQTLPDEVRDLIARKLSHLQREHQERLLSKSHAIFEKWDEKAKTRLSAQGSSVYVWNSIHAYKEVTSSVANTVKNWGEAVWGALKPILDNVLPIHLSSIELNSIADKWIDAQALFALNAIDAEQIKEMILRKTGRFGRIPDKTTTALKKRLDLEHTLAHVSITNTARQAHEKLSISIEEYLLTHRPSELNNNIKIEHEDDIQDQGPEVGSPEWRQKNAREAANARHDQPGGSRDKQRKIRELWATGKYRSRSECAETEHERLGMALTTAIDALKNTPKPDIS